MKVKGLLTALFVAVAMLFAPVAMAQDHKTPDAPADWLGKKNPEKSNKKSVDRGEKLYGKKCKKCHGSSGDGKGSASDDLKIKPAVMNAPGYMKSRKDGQLFWILMNGSKGTDMEAFGPGTEASISEEDIWHIINYMRKEFTK